MSSEYTVISTDISTDENFQDFVSAEDSLAAQLAVSEMTGREDARIITVLPGHHESDPTCGSHGVFAEYIRTHPSEYCQQ